MTFVEPLLEEPNPALSELDQALEELEPFSPLFSTSVGYSLFCILINYPRPRIDPNKLRERVKRDLEIDKDQLLSKIYWFFAKKNYDNYIEHLKRSGVIKEERWGRLRLYYLNLPKKVVEHVKRYRETESKTFVEEL